LAIEIGYRAILLIARASKGAGRWGDDGRLGRRGVATTNQPTATITATITIPTITTISPRPRRSGI
jgi:hypothetical protein